jgi:TolA-binding protein
MTTYPESSFSRDAGVQMGMIYFGMNDIEKSIEWYKYTIETFAGSDEANVANEDLKRIYKDQNRIGEYAQFLKTLGGKVIFSASEQDSLMYLGAEKIYMKGQKQVAESSFKEYLKEFPAGAFSLNANYYLATLNLDEKKDSVATIYLQNIVNRPDNKFTQQALKSSAEIAYSQSNYDKAYTYYKALVQKAESSKKRTEIRTKMLRCLWFGNKPSDVIEAATIILDDPKAEIAAKIESRYYRAKSNLVLQKSDNLVADLTILAADTRNVMGAEAKYLLANYYFDTENSKKAESEILDYIEKGTAHQHWLARSFILLSDIYLKNNDQFQARQYLLSLKNNYKEKDPEIEKMIDERITKFQ